MDPTIRELLTTLAIPALLLVVLGFLIGAAVGSCRCGTGWQEAATEAGVAEWRVDPKTGATEFVWIKCQEVGL
jgi:hypothetical protein